MSAVSTRNQSPLPVRAMLEALESRQLLSVTVTQALENTSGTPGTTGAAVDLSANFNDPAIPTIVRVGTQLGNVDIQLLDTQKPATVQNFLNYVHRGAYDTTFIHRSTAASTGLQVIQGGGYAFPGFGHIETDPPVVNEFTTNGTVSNTRGTVAMAKTSDPNSATSEWFVNVSDNATALDDPTNSGGFTVFGNVINGTLTTVDALAAVPTVAAGDPFGEIPLVNYTAADLSAGKVPATENLLMTTVETLPELSFTATSSDPSVATPTISGNKLTLAYGSTVGSATITVTATDGANQSVVGTFNAENALTVTLGTGGVNGVSFTDADGTVGTISFKGAGTAVVRFDGTGLAGTNNKGTRTVSGTDVVLTSITATGTNGKSGITINAKGGNGSVSVGKISADGALGGLSAKTAALTESFTTGGAVGKLDLGSATNAQIIMAGSTSDKPVSITLGSMTDSSLTCDVPIKSLKAASFTGTDDTADRLAAPGIQTLTVAGDFIEDLSTGPLKSIKVGGNLSGNLQASLVSTVSVGGNFSDSTLTLSQAFAVKLLALKSLKVNGAIANTTINAAANIGTVTASSMSGSKIFAAVSSQTLPAAAGDFANDASIKSVKINGDFSSSSIAAKSLGKVTTGSLTTANGGTAFGFAGDTIAGITTSVSGARISLHGLKQQSDVVKQLNGVDLGDAKVNVI